MKKSKKNIIISIVAVFILIQLIPIKRTNPPVSSDFDGPTEVKAIFKRSCYDCHSNETQWRWYSYIAPISWVLAHDVKEARSEFNFSNWNDIADVQHMKDEIYEEISSEKMPLPIYLLIHPQATLTDDEKKLIKSWVADN